MVSITIKMLWSRVENEKASTKTVNRLDSAHEGIEVALVMRVAKSSLNSLGRTVRESFESEIGEKTGLS